MSSTNSTNSTGSTNQDKPSSNLSTRPLPSIEERRSPYLALQFLDFRLLLIGTFFASLGEQMINVAIGWELYNRTGSALILGFVGLAQVTPILLFSLPAGHIADRYNRKHIMLIGLAMVALSALGLTLLSLFRGPLVLIYVCLFCIGLATAFYSPASSAMTPQTIPDYAFGSAATWSSSTWQLAAVLGPAFSGMLIALMHSAVLVYALNVGTNLLFLLLLLRIRVRQLQVAPKEGTTLRALGEGLRFLGRTQIILAAITLDLFAVLLGGATTLLPIFAKDILHVGAAGLGWLRTAPSVGAICVAFSLAYAPPFKRAGWTLLLAVVGFGAATIIFGLSHFFWLSLTMLFLLGGFDNISVVIRSTLLMTRTPNEMRGRVGAVNSLFIGASNELGGFESGVVAQLFGPIASVVGGGVGTILVVAGVALLWPEMRRLRRLDET